MVVKLPQTRRLVAPIAPEPPPLDVPRLVRVLEDHGVEYLLVGGVAAIAHGATRATKDFDCLARRTSENLQRLAAAMRELGARLHVEGIADKEAAQLPVQLDEQTLAGMEISTWRTEAGDFDVLVDMPDSTGRRRSYEELVGHAESFEFEGVAVQAAPLEDLIASKEWADRPKDHEALPELRAIRDRLKSS